MLNTIILFIFIIILIFLRYIFLFYYKPSNHRKISVILMKMNKKIIYSIKHAHVCVCNHLCLVYLFCVLVYVCMTEWFKR